MQTIKIVPIKEVYRGAALLVRKNFKVALRETFSALWPGTILTVPREEPLKL